MSKTKKALSLLTISLLLFCVSSTAYAKDNTLRYVVSCPVAAKHNMWPYGSAEVFEGSMQNPGNRVLSGAFINQCTYCYLVLASEGDPRQSGILGKYALTWHNQPVGTTGTYIYGGLTGEFYGSLIQDSFWQGFSFPGVY